MDLDLPRACEKRVGILRIHGEVGASGVLVDEEDLLPRLAAVGGLEDAALVLRLVHLAGSANVNDVGIGGMHQHARDASSFLQPHVMPCASGVGGFVSAVADGHV